MRRVNRNNACASNRLIFDFFRIRDLWAKVRGKGESGKEKMPKIIWASQSWFILLRIVKIVKISIRSPLVIFDVSSSAKFISSSSLSSYFDSNGHISIHTPVFDQVEFDILSFSRRCPWKYISKCVLLSIFYSENMPIVFTHWTRTKRERAREMRRKVVTSIKAINLCSFQLNQALFRCDFETSQGTMISSLGYYSHERKVWRNFFKEKQNRLLWEVPQNMGDKEADQKKKQKNRLKDRRREKPFSNRRRKISPRSSIDRLAWSL